MILDVEVYKLDTHTLKDKKIGRIWLLESGRLTYWPRGNSLLRKMVKTPLWIGREIQPEAGEDFISNMYKHFKNPYLRCTQAREKD